MGIGDTEHPSGASLIRKVMVIVKRLVHVAGLDLTCGDVVDSIRVLRHRLTAEKTRAVPRLNPLMGS